MTSRIPVRQISTPSPLSGSSAEDSSFYDRGHLDRSTGSAVVRSSLPTPPKARTDGDVEKVKVYARIRPALRDDETPGALVWSEDSGQLTIFRPEAPVPHSDFVYDKVLGPNSSQADVYNTAVHDVVRDVLRGYNGTILAYGQTGAGKTYTLGNTAPDAIGMIPRAAAELFSAATRDPLNTYSITMSYIQIYMEMIQDLLNPTADNLPIREDANGVFVAGACEMPVSSLEECLHYLELGEQNRVFAFTHLNAHSSRSHAVVMLTAVKSRKYLTSEERAQAEAPDQDGVVTQKVTVGKLYMVDLAGSERLKKSKSVGLRATEARSINLSLTTLGMCISARAQDSIHVPFRDSKLTRLLQESLGGNAKTSLILCLSDVRQHADESLQSLQFGARAACVRNKPVVNERLQMRQLTAELLAALEENHERADGLEAALSQTKEERDMLQAALAREKAHTARIVDALRAEAKARDAEQAAKLAAQAELLSNHVQQLGQVQQQQGQLELEMEEMRRERKAREAAHQEEVAALQQRIADLEAEAEEAAAAAAVEREAIKAEAQSQQAQLAASAQQQTTALATRLAQERAASRDQAASVHLALTRLQRAFRELVAGPAHLAAPPPLPCAVFPPPPSGEVPAAAAEAQQDAVAERPLAPTPPAQPSAAVPVQATPSHPGKDSSGGAASVESSGGGAGDGWGSAAASLRGRSEGSGWGSQGGGAAATPAGDAGGRRAQWVASLAAAVASRRGLSAGSAGSAVAGSSSGSRGNSSGGGSAVQLIKQALGIAADGSLTAAAGDEAGHQEAAVGVGEGCVNGSTGSAGGRSVGVAAHLTVGQPSVASSDKPFISPPCSSPRSLGGAAQDSVQAMPYALSPYAPAALAPRASVSGGGVSAVSGVSVGGVELGALGIDTSQPQPPSVSVDSASTTAGPPGPSASLLLTTPQPHTRTQAMTDTGSGQRDAATPAIGTVSKLSGSQTPDSDEKANGLMYGRVGGGAADARPLPCSPPLPDDPSGVSLDPQSLTVSSSSAGGEYGVYGGSTADDGAVNSYGRGGMTAHALSTPFLHTTGLGAATNIPSLLAAEGNSLTVPYLLSAGGAAQRSVITAASSSLRLGSSTLNHNPAFDAVDSPDSDGLLKAVVEEGDGAAGLGGRPAVASCGVRIRRLGDSHPGSIAGDSPGVAGPGSAALAAAAAPWLGAEPGSAGGPGVDATAPSPESSLCLLLPPPISDDTQPVSLLGQGSDMTQGSALFAGIHVQLASLLEMAEALRRVKGELEAKAAQQATELVRQQEEQLRLQAEAGQTGEHLQASHTALAAAETQLAETVSELRTVRRTLDDTVQELGRTRQELDERSAELQATRQQLGDTAGRLEDSVRRLDETGQMREASQEEVRRLASELEQIQTELSSERTTLRVLRAASARSQEVSAQAMAARHELQRQVRAANAIKRAYKQFKVAQLRSQVEAKQRALQEAAALQRDRETAQAARAGQALVQESVAAIQDAVGSILAAFLGRRYELEGRRALLERLDKMLPAAGSASAGTATTVTGSAARRGAGPVMSGSTSMSSVATTAASRGVGARGVASGSSGAAFPQPSGLATAPSLIRSRLGSNPMSLSMMLAAATLPLSPSPSASRALSIAPTPRSPAASVNQAAVWSAAPVSPSASSSKGVTTGSIPLPPLDTGRLAAAPASARQGPAGASASEAGTPTSKERAQRDAPNQT